MSSNVSQQEHLQHHQFNELLLKKEYLIRDEATNEFYVITLPIGADDDGGQPSLVPMSSIDSENSLSQSPEISFHDESSENLVLKSSSPSGDFTYQIFVISDCDRADEGVLYSTGNNSNTNLDEYTSAFKGTVDFVCEDPENKQQLVEDIPTDIQLISLPINGTIMESSTSFDLLNLTEPCDLNISATKASTYSTTSCDDVNLSIHDLSADSKSTQSTIKSSVKELDAKANCDTIDLKEKSNDIPLRPIQIASHSSSDSNALAAATATSTCPTTSAPKARKSESSAAATEPSQDEPVDPVQEMVARIMNKVASEASNANQRKSATQFANHLKSQCSSRGHPCHSRPMKARRRKIPPKDMIDAIPYLTAEEIREQLLHTEDTLRPLEYISQRKGEPIRRNQSCCEISKMFTTPLRSFQARRLLAMHARRLVSCAEPDDGVSDYWRLRQSSNLN